MELILRKVMLVGVLVILLIITAGSPAGYLNEKSIHNRIKDRDFPSVFQAWNPIDMPHYPMDTLDDRLKTAAKHNLLWEEPVSQLGYGVKLVLGAVWDHRHGGLATKFTDASLGQAIKNRKKMLAMNPNMVFLMEVRWRDAPGSFLPEDSEFWKRNSDGSRMLGWDGGPEPYYMLDYDNKAFHENIARQSKICIESGVYDGIMLDWSGYLPVVKTVREAIGDSGLIIVNIHDDIHDAKKYQDYINGSFMELNPGDGSPNPYDNKRDWAKIREALLYFEKNFLEPQINCLEVWGDRKDLSRMRATTCLGLTHSDGYVLYADPNPLSTPDHLHDWYAFWDVSLGKPTGALQNRADGAYQRRFEGGIVVYNPYKNGSIKVTFDKSCKQASTGRVDTQFTIADRDGDIFLDQESPIAAQKSVKLPAMTGKNAR